MNRLILAAGVAMTAMIGSASAYTGPGLGAGVIAVVIGFFTSIGVALFAIVWYPVKRLLKRGKKPHAAKAGGASAAAARKDDAARDAGA